MSDHQPFLALITPVDDGDGPSIQPPSEGGLPDQGGPPSVWPLPPSVSQPEFPTQLPTDLDKPGMVWPPLHPSRPPRPPRPWPQPPTVGGGPAPEPPPVVGGGPAPEPPPVVGGGPAPEPPVVGGGPMPEPPTVGGGPVMPPRPTLPSNVMVVLAWVPGVGFRWIVVDISLTPDQGLPPGVPDPGHPETGLPGQPDQGLPPAPDQGGPTPPSATPKR